MLFVIAGDQHEHVAGGLCPHYKGCQDIRRDGSRHLSHPGGGQRIHLQDLLCSHLIVKALCLL